MTYLYGSGGGGGGGDGGWTLIETQTFTGAALKETTFSGLNGEVDEFYRIIFRIENDNGAVGPSFFIRPNGLTTNLTSTQAFCDDIFTQLQFKNKAGILFIGQCGGREQLSGEVFFHAAHKSSMPRMYFGSFVEYLTGSPTVGHSRTGGIWNDTSTTLTSIVIRATGSYCIGVNSRISLYKAVL